MAPHSSTLAWKIPWTEEPGGLQSMGLLRVRHDWATSLSCTGEGNGNPHQCPCLENPRDGGAWWAADCGVAQGRTGLEWLSSSGSVLYSGCNLKCYVSERNCQVYKHSFFTSHSNLLTFPSPVTGRGAVRGDRMFLSLDSGVCSGSSEHLADLQLGSRQVRSDSPGLPSRLNPRSLGRSWLFGKTHSVDTVSLLSQCPAHNGQ